MAKSNDKSEGFSSHEEIEKAFSDLDGAEPNMADLARKVIEENIALGRRSRTALFRSNVLLSETQQETRDFLDKMGAPLNLKNEILSPARRFQIWQADQDNKLSLAIDQATRKVKDKYTTGIFWFVTILLAIFGLWFGY